MKDSTSEIPQGTIIGGAAADGSEAPGRSAFAVPRAAVRRGASGLRPEGSAPSADATTEADWRAARARAQMFDEYLRLTEVEHLTAVGAAQQLGAAASLFSGPAAPLQRYLREGVAALLPARADSLKQSTGELTRALEGLGWFVPAARWFYLNTNRTNASGSVPEAVRRAISLPNLPTGWSEATRRKFQRMLSAVMLPEENSGGGTWFHPHETEAVLPAGGDARAATRDASYLPTFPPDLREAILARQTAGLPLVPNRIARQITVNPVTIRQHRHGTNAALDYLSAPGSLFFILDKLSGQRRPPRIGEVIEADDATINFPVCVPWSLGGDPCSDKFGVKVGRFQWLVCVDAASRYVTAWTYVMRPRSSYRAEDALALMRAHCLQHGIPGQWRFEQGVWKSNLVKLAIAGIGSDLHTVWSPHQKPYIEGLFNTLWTKLSVQFPDSDIGRYQGETEAANDLLVACQRGHRDPRAHFPMLSQALAAFGEVIAEKQNTPVTSAIGRWVPAERWAARGGLARAADEPARGDARPTAFPFRPLDGETEWLFSPYVREWTVRGMLVGGRVPLFEDLSVPFDFTADWLAQYHGAKVRCHFNPGAPSCSAMVVLAQNFATRKAGEVLGLAKQINEVAGYARLVLGWGDDNTNAGRLARQRAASALRREVRAVAPGGRGYAHSEERDGVNQITQIERSGDGDGQGGASVPASRLVRSLAPPTGAPEAIELDAGRLARSEQFQRDHALDFLT